MKPVRILTALLLTVALPLLQLTCNSGTALSVRLLDLPGEHAFADLLAYVLFWFLALWIVWRPSGQSLTEWCRFKPFRLTILAPLLLTAVGTTLILLVLLNWVGSPRSKATEGPSAELSTFTSFLGGVLIAPIAEELFFRRWMLGGLLQSYTARAALLVSALLFAAVHFSDVNKVIVSFPMGLLFGWAFYATDSLIPAVSAHVATNLTSMYLPYVLLRLAGPSEAEMRAQRAPAWMLLLGCGMACGGIVLLRYIGATAATRHER